MAARNFTGDARGGVAILFGLALLPIMALLGMAIDYGRVTEERVSFQRSVDSGVLAGSVLNLPDDQRLQRARDAFAGMLTPKQQAHLLTANFTMDAAKTKITGTVTLSTPTVFGPFTGQSPITMSVDAAALIARPQVRQLDLVMCIDGTGSMTPTINAVKTNALNFEANLNAELQSRGVAKFEVIRVRPIIYRDFGGNTWYDPIAGGWAITSTGYTYIFPNDPNKAQYVGDVPPMMVSNFYNLSNSSERTAYSNYVQAQSAWGGGDEPESGLECVNEGIDSTWAKVGDVVNGKTLTGIYPTIVVWTDANTHPPSWPLSLQNPLYPNASKMPRTHAALKAKWQDATKIDQSNKLLVFFGGPASNILDAQGWPPVYAWSSFYNGGTLSDGNTQMVKKIVDALVSKINQPTLTQ